MRLVFSRLIEFALAHQKTMEALHINISAHLLPSATRIVFKITPSELTNDDCRALFNPFYNTEGYEEDVDFGLALIKKVIETIGGNIIVCKDDSNSAVFSLFLPHRHP